MLIYKVLNRNYSVFFTEFGQTGRIVDNNYPKFRCSLIENCD